MTKWNPESIATLRRLWPDRSYSTADIGRSFGITNRRVPLERLGRHDCRWPFGEGPYLFCGRPAVHGAYCKEHGLLAYHMPKPKEEDAKNEPA